jgi:AAHS family 3-hydroxyphenylpropionic acid transporter
MSFENQAVAPQRAGSLTVGLCCLVAVLEGFDLQAAGVSAPRLSQSLGLTSAQLGWFFSSSTFGLMVGAAIGGRLSDRYGRKIALLLSVLMFGLLSIVTGLAGNDQQLLAARFLTGVGLGGALPNIIALVAENMPLYRRSWAIGLLYAGMPFGGAIASLTSLVGAAPADWRAIFFVGGIAPLAALPLLTRLLPGRAPPPPRPANPRTDSSADGFFRAVFGEQRAASSAILWVGFFLALSIMYLLLSWLPSLLISRGLTRGDAALVQAAFNIFGAVGSVLTGWLMDQSRWRTIVAVGVFGATALTIASVAGAPSSLVAWLMLGGALGATVSGCQATLYGLAPSCYPMAVRGTGVGVAVSVGRCGAAVGPLLAAQMLTAGFSSNQVMLTLLPVVAIAGLATTILSLRPAVDQ